MSDRMPQLHRAYRENTSPFTDMAFVPITVIPKIKISALAPADAVVMLK